MSYFLNNIKERVTPDDQTSSCAKTDILFLTYNNPLSDSLSSNINVFADNTSIFSVARGINA